MTDSLPEPIPAATLILMRERGGGAPDLLMMERSRSMAFAAGALVFPGGRIDPDDHVVAERLGAEFGDAAARVAAIRETLEETGIAVAIVPGPAPELADSLRQALERGEDFSALLGRHGLSLDLAALTPFARWCPTFKEARRFDTLFFLAEAPADAPEATAAEAEAVRTWWAQAATVLQEADAGRARIIFPTRRNLERLARFASLAEAGADAARHPVARIVPWIEDREGTSWLRIPDDAGYPVTAELLDSARRT
jgi:8-oxo-dGTP pyrophosphatase MutT (NUDIX family)